jgi:hypothetical protein
VGADDRRRRSRCSELTDSHKSCLRSRRRHPLRGMWCFETPTVSGLPLVSVYHPARALGSPARDVGGAGEDFAAGQDGLLCKTVTKAWLSKRTRLLTTSAQAREQERRFPRRVAGRGRRWARRG